MGLLRHAGTVEQVFTPTGAVFVQTGKDLTAVKTLVLTGGDNQTVEPLHYLRLSCRLPMDKVYGLYSTADAGLIAECAKKFTDGSFPILIAAPKPALTAGVKARRVVLYYPPYSAAALDSALASVITAGSIFLCYNNDDLEEIKTLLLDLPPERELLAELYTMLRRNGAANKTITLDSEKTTRRLSAKLGKPVRDYSIHAALLILADLNLIKTSVKGNAFNVNLLPPPREKGDLRATAAYQRLSKKRDDYILWTKSLLNDR